MTMTKAEIRETLDNALMTAVGFRRANHLVMRGWQTIGDKEGIKVVINLSSPSFGDCKDYDKFYNVITLTEEGKFKVNIWDKRKDCLSDCIERENEYRKENEEELLQTEFDNVIEALRLGHEIVDYWGLGDFDEYED